jgi:hypothetical protein
MDYVSKDFDSTILEPESKGSNEVPHKQWTIKNIEEEVVDKARDAAKKNGMKISSWVSARLRQAAETDLAEPKLGGDDNKLVLELKQMVQSIADFQSTRITQIENDLNSVLKAQHSMLAAFLDKNGK